MSNYSQHIIHKQTLNQPFIEGILSKKCIYNRITVTKIGFAQSRDSQNEIENRAIEYGTSNCAECIKSKNKFIKVATLAS